MQGGRLSGFKCFSPRGQGRGWMLGWRNSRTKMEKKKIIKEEKCVTLGKKTGRKRKDRREEKEQEMEQKVGLQVITQVWLGWMWGDGERGGRRGRKKRKKKRPTAILSLKKGEIGWRAFTVIKEL